MTLVEIELQDPPLWIGIILYYALKQVEQTPFKSYIRAKFSRKTTFFFKESVLAT